MDNADFTQKSLSFVDLYQIFEVSPWIAAPISVHFYASAGGGQFGVLP